MNIFQAKTISAPPSQPAPVQRPGSSQQTTPTGAPGAITAPAVSQPQQVGSGTDKKPSGIDLLAELIDPFSSPTGGQAPPTSSEYH